MPNSRSNYPEIEGIKTDQIRSRIEAELISFENAVADCIHGLQHGQVTEIRPIRDKTLAALYAAFETALAKRETQIPFTPKQIDLLLDLIGDEALKDIPASKHAQMNRICAKLYNWKRLASLNREKEA